MSSYEELFLLSQANPDKILAIENITKAFVTLLGRIADFKHSIPQCSEGTSSNSGSSNLNNNNSHSLDDDDLCNKLREDLNPIKAAFHDFKQLVTEPINDFECSLDDIFKILEQCHSGSLMTKLVQAKLSALENSAMKLTFHIPSLPPDISTSSDFHRYYWKNQPSSVVKKSPSLHVGRKFLYSSVFTELQEVFEDLDIKLKRCLLCFAVVPENEVVKKRLLINWWVGECLVEPPDTGEKTGEEIADEILTELMLKGFVEPVNKRNKPITDQYKMRPRVRFLVIILATEGGFFDYDFDGNSTENYAKCYRTFLMKAKTREQVQQKKTSEDQLANNLNSYQEKLQTIFNVNDPFPFLRFDWFSKMKNVNVLYLGRWQSLGKYHIEVESTDFLKGLKNMKCLRLLSLQGISGIDELPHSIGKVTTLRILDLKACHNLVALPDEITLLKQLTHLDISECYLLDGLPKGLAHLSKLQVLKGFLIGSLEGGSSCTLEDLIGLKNLIKLSINTSSKAFPEEKELHALSKLGALRKLAISWNTKQENVVLNSANTVNSDNGGDNGRQDSGAEKLTRAPKAAKLTRAISKQIGKLPIRDPETPDLPLELEKLEFQCFPHTETPKWLIAGKLKSLKKLYIRGGELENLGQIEGGNDKWEVTVLRLKHLNKFKMSWEERETSFPNLTFLENFNCPNTSWPCNEYGVWLK